MVNDGNISIISYYISIVYTHDINIKTIICQYKTHYININEYHTHEIVREIDHFCTGTHVFSIFSSWVSVRLVASYTCNTSDLQRNPHPMARWGSLQHNWEPWIGSLENFNWKPWFWWIKVGEPLRFSPKTIYWNLLYFFNLCGMLKWTKPSLFEDETQESTITKGWRGGKNNIWGAKGLEPSRASDLGVWSMMGYRQQIGR